MAFEPLILLAPLLAATVAGLGQRFLGDRLAMAITTGSVGLALALSVATFVDYVWLGGEARVIELFKFIDVGGFTSTWSVRIDTLSAIMLVVVTSVSFLVHVYSWGYMAEDPHRARFFAYLSFFTFAMLALVTANDFLQMFFGWEGVGVASYLLIGFWYDKRSANDAAIKAFVVNRVGDFGFALGIMACFFAYGSIRFDEVFAAAAANPALVFDFRIFSVPAIEAIAVLLFIGAMGKSAQFFLHVWLPDAMEGPTPVSALIHAATMVTAGVFMVCRCSSLYELAPTAAAFVTITGAVTALFAATVGLAQNDIKRVVAYSTCSQLGYMFFAAGVGAYGAAMFHLFTHAFFKALLFLGAGSVIHGMHHEQDMRFMGGVRQPMMFTWAMMLIGTLALTGVGIPGTQIGFAGFFSKDAIIESAFAAGEGGRVFGQVAFWCGVTAAFLTSFYSWRLMFMAFEGKFRPNPAAHHEEHAHDGHGDAHAVDDHADEPGAHPAKAPEGAAPAHESPAVMTAPLAILAAGAVFAGVFFAPYFLKDENSFWRGAIERSHDPLYPAAGAPGSADSHDGAAAHGASTEEGHAPAPAAGHGEAAAHGEDAHHVPTWVLWAPFVVTLAGFLLALPIYLFSQTMGAAIARTFAPLNAFLTRKWYFDELYDAVFVRGARALGDLFWKGGDKKIIDGLGPDGFAWMSRFTARQMRRSQTGYVYHYSFFMLVAVAAVGAFAIWQGGGVTP
ncbi:MAG: NADH-quinone oxidoreductase subunit L [Hyphomonadaceae bacterium]|nr:NADH-quinone oxidoreductase subunit L [Hyphomonadaceae bacterium]